MGKYQLKIILLSDLCVSDGGVYNSSLDTDICHDELGFPYIPAKRLKGCLRECALELNDWGKEIPIKELFGEKGNGTADLRLGNAYLEGIGQMRKEAIKYQNSLVCHPQNILNHFSYIRTQTSIDYDTGIADDTSLRTIRVANKGLRFIAEAEFQDMYYEAFSSCCKALTTMGVARTRGLGEVKVTLEKKKEEKNNGDLKNIWKRTDCLEYTLYLNEPLICKSVNGGESRTMDYIEGSKILGLIAQQMKKDGKNITTLLDCGELFCSNAYIQHGDTRMLEVPATYHAEKNDNINYIDKVYETKELREQAKKESRQFKQIKHCYIAWDKAGCLIQKNVNIEERYHHRRPGDKSIGRACEDKSGDSTFYQMSSIAAGQTFRGYIMGTAEQIREIFGYLSKVQEFYMGYSRSAEYGKVQIFIIKIYERPIKILKNCREFTIKLEAPAIIYSHKAMYSIFIGDLIDEVNATLGIESAQVDTYINYITIGGYNVTWNARKPVIEAFDKGTVLHYRLDKPVDVPELLLLGERILEGFGEATVSEVEPKQCRQHGKKRNRHHGKKRNRHHGKKQSRYNGKVVVIDEDMYAPAENEIHITNSQLLKGICDDLLQKFIQMEAWEATKEIGTENIKVMKPTVANMIMMWREIKTIEDKKNNEEDTAGKEESPLSRMRTMVEDRFGNKPGEKSAKNEEANKILDDMEKKCGKLFPEFCGKYQLSGYSFDQSEYEYIYIKEYLNGLRYRIRAKEKKVESQHE